MSDPDPNELVQEFIAAAKALRALVTFDGVASAYAELDDGFVIRAFVCEDCELVHVDLALLDRENQDITPIGFVDNAVFDDG